MTCPGSCTNSRWRPSHYALIIRSPDAGGHGTERGSGVQDPRCCLSLLCASDGGSGSSTARAFARCCSMAMRFAGHACNLFIGRKPGGSDLNTLLDQLLISCSQPMAVFCVINWSKQPWTGSMRSGGQPCTALAADCRRLVPSALSSHGHDAEDPAFRSSPSDSSSQFCNPSRLLT